MKAPQAEPNRIAVPKCAPRFDGALKVDESVKSQNQDEAVQSSKSKVRKF